MTKEELASALATSIELAEIKAKSKSFAEDALGVRFKARAFASCFNQAVKALPEDFKEPEEAANFIAGRISAWIEKVQVADSGTELKVLESAPELESDSTEGKVSPDVESTGNCVLTLDLGQREEVKVVVPTDPAVKTRRQIFVDLQTSLRDVMLEYGNKMTEEEKNRLFTKGELIFLEYVEVHDPSRKEGLAEQILEEFLEEQKVHPDALFGVVINPMKNRESVAVRIPNEIWTLCTGYRKKFFDTLNAKKEGRSKQTALSRIKALKAQLVSAEASPAVPKAEAHKAPAPKSPQPVLTPEEESLPLEQLTELFKEAEMAGARGKRHVTGPHRKKAQAIRDFLVSRFDDEARKQICATYARFWGQEKETMTFGRARYLADRIAEYGGEIPSELAEFLKPKSEEPATASASPEASAVEDGALVPDQFLEEATESTSFECLECLGEDWEESVLENHERPLHEDDSIILPNEADDTVAFRAQIVELQETIRRLEAEASERKELEGSHDGFNRLRVLLNHSATGDSEAKAELSRLLNSPNLLKRAEAMIVELKEEQMASQERISLLIAAGKEAERRHGELKAELEKLRQALADATSKPEVIPVVEAASPVAEEPKMQDLKPAVLPWDKMSKEQRRAMLQGAR